MCNKLAKVNFEQWNGFKGDRWKEKIDVRNFISMNYTPYDGDASFLEGPTEATDKLWGKLQQLQKEERAKGGVLDMETEVVTGITAYGPGYIDEDMKDLEQVVGLQTDKPLKRAFMPYGGIKMAEQACETYGYHVSDKIKDIFNNYEFKTHNQGVFDIYTPEMKRARHNKILTGLPDTYGRGRIVGDYRRVALYGIDFLIAGKEKDFAACDRQGMRRYDFQLREEIADQIRALKKMKEMAQIYGFDISQPAKNAKEAFQWLYFGYLAAIKTQNGAAMSVGRISTFLDIYIERDLENGTLTEKAAQELVDHMVMKFRMVKFARIPSYNQLFSGDPVWATLEVAGMGQDGRSMVTKNDYRFLHTLEDMGPAPEPNLTVLYSSRLPENFKKYADVYRNMFQIVDAVCLDDNMEQLADQVDVIFTATPQGLCASLVNEEILSKVKIIDLSADFRIKDVKTYEKWYGIEHKSPQFIEEAVYGLCEVNREDIKGARLIANPGCYTTCSILTAYPLAKEGLIDMDTLIIDAKSGTSGAGRGAKVPNLYCEVNENMKAYGVATHRHTPEIEEQLGYASGKEVVINFTPHLVPMNRGILATEYAKLTKDVTWEEVKAVYDKYYANEKFVRVLEKDVYPETKWVEGSNYVDIGFKIDPRTNRIIMMGAIDNLVKGAAGQAVQNMNLIFGLPESEGLDLVPMFP